MKNLNTYTDTWNSVWAIGSFDIPCAERTLPDSINYIDYETHKSLLSESLDIYDEIWTNLAKK